MNSMCLKYIITLIITTNLIVSISTSSLSDALDLQNPSETSNYDSQRHYSHLLKVLIDSAVEKAVRRKFNELLLELSDDDLALNVRILC